jgi:hypothetical protein
LSLDVEKPSSADPRCPADADNSPKKNNPVLWRAYFQHVQSTKRRGRPVRFGRFHRARLPGASWQSVQPVNSRTSSSKSIENAISDKDTFCAVRPVEEALRFFQVRWGDPFLGVGARARSSRCSSLSAIFSTPGAVLGGRSSRTVGTLRREAFTHMFSGISSAQHRASRCLPPPTPPRTRTRLFGCWLGFWLFLSFDPRTPL